MVRVPLLFGTPSSSSCSGSLADLRPTYYHHDEKAFPALYPTPITMNSTRTLSYTHIALSFSTTTKTLPTLPCSLPPLSAQDDSRFETAISALDNRLEQYQFAGAKQLLSLLPADAHDKWLRKLHHSLKNNIPMASPLPPKKQYYKTHFRPIFTDSLSLPYASSTPNYDDVFRAPTPKRYNIWTDRALATYAAFDFVPVFLQQKRRKVCRPSSFVRCKQHYLIQNTDSSTAAAPESVSLMSPCSVHVFQFSTHRKQHQSYVRYVNDDTCGSLSYLTSRTPSPPQDSVGSFRAKRSQLQAGLEFCLRRDLDVIPYFQWNELLSNHLITWSLCRTLRPSANTQKNRSSPQTTSFTSTAQPLGLGIAHFSSQHRLQRRFRRAQLERVQSFRVPSFQESQPLTYHVDSSIAPIFRQHSSHDPESTIAPLFRQHYFHNPLDSVHTLAPPFCPNSLYSKSLSAPSFWQHDSSIYYGPAFRIGFESFGNHPCNIPRGILLPSLPSLGNLSEHCNFGILNPWSYFPYSHLAGPSLRRANSCAGLSRLEKPHCLFTFGISNPTLFPYDNSCTSWIDLGYTHILQESTKRPQEPQEPKTEMIGHRDISQCPSGPGHFSDIIYLYHMKRLFEPPTLRCHSHGPLGTFTYIAALWRQQLLDNSMLPAPAAIGFCLYTGCMNDDYPPFQPMRHDHCATNSDDIGISTASSYFDLVCSTTCTCGSSTPERSRHSVQSDIQNLLAEPTFSFDTPLPNTTIRCSNFPYGISSSQLFTPLEQHHLDCTVGDSFFEWVSYTCQPHSSDLMSAIVPNTKSIPKRPQVNQKLFTHDRYTSSQLRVFLLTHSFSHVRVYDDILEWHLGYRFGEALHPGPAVSILSVNITSLALHFTHLLHYDILLVQETRLTSYGHHYLQQLLSAYGWSALWGTPRPPQQSTAGDETISGKCGGVAILYKSHYQFQIAPDFLLEAYPSLCTHRFIHGILSTEHGPSMHFMSVYGFTGADVHVEAQSNNDSLMHSVFEYAASFGNTPVYIGMDANTATVSSSSLSQAYLSQRWYDLGLLFSQLKDEPLQPTCFAKGNTIGRRIDYVFVNSPAVLSVTNFYVDVDTPIPTHRPLIFTISVDLFSSQITRLALPPTDYNLPKPSVRFLDTFHSLFYWDINKFSRDIDAAYSCWTMWAQQYLTLLSDHDFHSRGAAPCIKTGQPATPISRELPASYRPYAVLFNQTVSTIAELEHNPNAATDSRLARRIATIRSSARSLLPTFHPVGPPYVWLPLLRNSLTLYRLHEQHQIQHDRREAWQSWIRDTWALNSKKIYQLVKGKFVEPFTCLQHEGNIITDWGRIDKLLQEAWMPIFAKYPTGETKADDYNNACALTPEVYPPTSFSRSTLEDLHYVLRKKLKSNTATGLDGWRPHELKSLPDCLLSALLDIYDLCEQVGRFPSSFYYSYTTLIPKGLARTPLSLRPVTVLPVPYRLYASLRCQTLLKWQDTWIHSSQFAFCKGRSTTSLNCHLSFDLLSRYQQYGCFAGLQFDFAKCFDSIPYSVIWSTLKHYGCDPTFVALLSHLYGNMLRCFRYAGCIGSFWSATNGLLQGDPLSVVILNCVLCPLVNKLSTIGDLSVYAFADDLTIVSSSWEILSNAYAVLCQFCAATDLHLNLSKCQMWNKGLPHGQYPSDFDRFTFCFYPFLLGSPIDIGVPYDDSLCKLDNIVLTRAKRIAKLPLPYAVSYRLFTSLVSSCYNHYALSCDMSSSQNTSLKHAINTILVPKRSRWVCREALYSLVTPGHLLSPQLFLNYRHVIEYLLFVRQTTPDQRNHLLQLWDDTISIQWGPLWRLRSAAKHLGFIFEDPFVFTVHNNAYSVDEELHSLKHIIRDSYRQFYLSKASQRRQDCHGQTNLINIPLTRAFYFSINNPLHQSILRHVLTGSLDHTHRLFKSNLTTSPTCPYCQTQDETAEHIFWYCTNWIHVRAKYPSLMRLFSLVGTQWPACFLHCGWIEQNLQYGISLLDNVVLSYTIEHFAHDTHHMYLHILLARYSASQVLRSIPVTPPHTPFDFPQTIPTSPSLCVQLPGDVSPISILSSPG